MLYHLSLDRIEKLTPRVPKTIFEGENKTIPRVCFSRSIDGALTALPYNVKLLFGLKELEEQAKVPPIIYIYKINENKINRENIVKTKTLSKKGLVKDAHVTGEVWVLEECSDMECEVVVLDDFYIDRRKIKDRKCIWSILDTTFKKADETLIRKNNYFWDRLYDKFKEELPEYDHISLKRRVLVGLYEK